MTDFEALMVRVRACTECAADLPLAPRPILQAGASARVLIAGQAPGAKAHEAGRPFADASGKRLRHWLGLDEATFYDPDRVAILPMGFCFPGRGASGDRPPRPECAPLWRRRLLSAMPDIRVTLVIGRYALDWHRPGQFGSLTEAVEQGSDEATGVYPMPHPSPRNQAWFKRHPWFEAERLPRIRQAVAEALK